MADHRRGVGAFLLAIGLISAMHVTLPEDATAADTFFSKWVYVVPGVLIVLYTMYGWWSDVVKEAHRGDHTRVVQLHLRYGMIMFIASEVMFFVAWFWAFFDASLYSGEVQQVARVEATGGQWPPAGMEVFDPWHLPLLNTLILLTSGTTVTWAHHALLHNDRQGPEMGTGADDHPRAAVHRHPGLRICVGAVRLCRQHLRRHLLHGDRLPRLPRHHRHDLPDRLPGARAERAISGRSSISASRPRPGTGISSTWSGCSSSPASMCGAIRAAITTERRPGALSAAAADRDGAEGPLPALRRGAPLRRFPEARAALPRLRARLQLRRFRRRAGRIHHPHRRVRRSPARRSSWRSPTARRCGCISCCGAPLVLILCLGLLRPLKGVLVAQQYVHRAAEGRLDRPD